MLDFLLNPEQRKIRDEARDLVRTVPRQLILDMDADRVEFPTEFLQEAGRRNLLGCRYPSRWGGRDLDWVATSAVMQEMGSLGYMFGCVFGVSGELVPDAIISHGTDAQKERWVKPLLRGRMFAAECLTEPRGGSDFFGTTSTALDRGDHFLLNGQKRFIVGGTAADVFLVYARTDPDAPPHKGITCFIVERCPGVETPYVYGLMGSRGGGASRLRFRDVKVPRENVLGGVNQGVKVFQTMMIPERLGTAAMTVGSASPALDIATGYATRRKAFGRTIDHFQGVSFQLAQAAMLLDTSRSAVHTTSLAVDTGQAPGLVRRLISQTKKFVTESCQQVVHNSMQILGGIGYTNIYPVERILRDLRLASIWTGTNEIMAMIVAGEWRKEYLARRGLPVRDWEQDAPEAFAQDEKIFE